MPTACKNKRKPAALRICSSAFVINLGAPVAKGFSNLRNGMLEYCTINSLALS